MVKQKDYTIDSDLYSKIEIYLKNKDIKFIEKAYNFAREAHDGQLRLSGEDFFEHPKQTAIFLADLKLDSSTIAAALLHDVVEDCDCDSQDIERIFGLDVSRLVDGVTKLSRNDVIGDSEFSPTTKFYDEDIPEDIAQAETLRKMLMAMADDVRVVLIKLADRLHNMRTISFLPLNRRLAMSRETIEIYAPLAHRLGIWEIKWLLEDLSFQQLNPQEYKNISKRLNSKRQVREDYVKNIVSQIENELLSQEIRANVYGRPKHIFSIHKKIQKYANINREVSEIHDLFAVRIIVDEVKDCYAALGVIHTKYHPLPNQFDDYIANPKDNLYQSLHTAVLGENSLPVEVQIRTKEMHQVAEYGVAAHWLYKEGVETDTAFEEKMTWLRKLLDWQRDASGPVDFVESFKTDIFQNQVFVYTPNEDVIELPIGATSLDFAYRIHTDVGHGCVGAKVNGKLVSLNHELNNGDTVQIMTSKTMKGPSHDWINPSFGYVKTASARAKIRHWFNRQERQTNIVRGKELFQKLGRLDLDVEEKNVAERLHYKNIEDLFVALGDGSLTTEKILNRLTLNEHKPTKSNIVETSRTGPASGIQVLGVGDLYTSIARCCNPIMGDLIVGFITRGRGVSVHRQNCPNILAEDESERLVSVTWGETKTLNPVRIQLKCEDRVGLLGDVTSVISNEKINIANINTEEYDDMVFISLTVYTSGIEQLDRLYTKLEAVSGVLGVIRLRGIASKKV
ncbi:MAG: (p)ppGpp synthetase [Chloroflexi bacterium]|nr:(p)ppGpp synthetase [Chloroflexota bacterium]